MKVPFKHRSWTIVVMPDSNRSSFQLNISQFNLLLISFICITLIGLSISLFISNKQTQMHSNQLEHQVALLEQTFSQTLTEKNAEIEQLRGHVLTLSEQADEVQRKMAALVELENELLVMTGNDPALLGNDDRSVRIASTSLSETEGPSGGPEIEVSNEDIEAFAKQTEVRFHHLNQNMDDLTEDLNTTMDLVAEFQEALRVTPSIWPTTSYQVTSNYGYRKDPFTYRTSFHSGIDIGGDYGDPVYATADGKVINADYDRGKGNYVEINHGLGLRTVYMHLSKRLVEAGDSVSKGDTIGQIGSTGRSTGPHLHYEVLKQGASINPSPYMNTATKDG